MNHLSGFQPTGLIKVCPRCKRQGTVLLDPVRGECVFAVVWDGPARNPYGHKQDVDTGLSMRTLLHSKFGCGYDPAEAAAVQERAA